MLRYAPNFPLPPYAFVPGLNAHPRRHAGGHSFGAAPFPSDVFVPNHWRKCATYLAGIDLFNHGFYWEAHEAWEALGAAGLPRDTAMGAFLRGLTKLAAAGVKTLQGRAGPTSSLARQAAAHFERAATLAPTGLFAGLQLTGLGVAARSFATVRIAFALLPVDGA